MRADALNAFFSWRLSLVAVAIVGLAATLQAHDPGLSTAEIAIGPLGVEVTIGLSPRDASRVSSPLPLQTRLSVGSSEIATSSGLGAQWCEIRTERRPVGIRDVKVDPPTADAVRFHLLYERIAGQKVVVHLPMLAYLPPGHREFVIVTNHEGEVLAKKFLTASDATLSFDSPSPESVAPALELPPHRVFLGFFVLGVEHIWTGYDHLLFLFGLLVVCRSFRSILGIISCFTVAHSLTLAAATLGWVNLPSRIVEPAIAASIVFVGVENLIRRGAEPVGRWALTFAFGLIHGFGFATALRDLGVSTNSGGAAWPLFTFNLGVEFGQVVVALIALPLVWRLRKREAFVRRGVPALSAVVAVAGTYWLLVRTLAA